MKKTIYASLAALMCIGMQSCKEEAPFSAHDDEGQVLTSLLALQLKGEEALTRAGNAPALDDFDVDFLNADGEVAASYKYAQMPEVVTLPVGDYTVSAHYGENVDAAFEAPYYLGSSESFSVVKDRITEISEPVECKLSNVKVTIVFDDYLTRHIDTNAAVTVKVGRSGELTFTRDEERSGYFAYVDASHTLTATFNGMVDGDATSEVKTYSDVKPGNHYRITFRLSEPDASDPGNIQLGDGSSLVIDAQVSVIDLTADHGNLDPEEKPMDDEGVRPSDGPNDNPDNPVDPKGPAPSISCVAPIVMGSPNHVKDGDTCVINITSESEGGITEFVVVIDSNTLTEEELEGVGLPKTLDMVNENDAWEVLSDPSMNFPVNVGGRKEVTFNLSSFIGLLEVLGTGTHNFHFTVSDANGTTRQTLTLLTD